MPTRCSPKIITETETVTVATPIAEKSCESAPIILQLSSASSWAEVAASYAGVAVTILALFVAVIAIIGLRELKNIVRGMAGKEAAKVSRAYYEQKEKTTKEELE